MKIELFLSSLFEIRINAHIGHLQSLSYAQHKALEELYTGIVDFTDRIAEAYQGDNEIIKGYASPKITEGLDFVEYLTEKVDEAADFREAMSDSPEIQAIVDELVEFYNAVKYKLRFLK